MQVDEQAEDQGVAWTPPATCPKFRERPLPGIDTPDAVVWSVSCQGALSAEGARRVAPLPSPLSISLFLSSPAPPLGDSTCRGVRYTLYFQNGCLLLRACVLLNGNKSDAFCDA